MAVPSSFSVNSENTGVSNVVQVNGSSQETKEEHPEIAASSDRTKARLARNRTTARLRRERKKHQAETLTKEVAELTFKLETLESHLDTLGAKAKKNILRAVDDFGPPPVACIFCDMDFPDNETKNKHVETNHAAELKARNIAKQNAAKEEQESRSQENEKVAGKLSYDSRRKRRLERNAQSARLCRQRKKLYIENLRMQLPQLRHRVESLRKLIPDADTVLEKKLSQSFKIEVTPAGTVSKSEAAGKASKAQVDSKQRKGSKLCSSPIQSVSVTRGPSGDIKVNIPRLSGWDSSSRRGNPNLKQSNTGGYESSGSNQSSGSSKSRGRTEKKEEELLTNKRRKGSTSVDISSGSPSPISTLTSFGLSPTPFALSSPIISGTSKTATFPFVLGQPVKSEIKTNSQDKDVFNAAVALSTLVPFAPMK
mmetsp:Transcript_3278/g.3707  ORF Transcript_3278/g.3707 Transcript_3278/m.3707 type:complete len:425 (-) Transcript_3278:136-1410(-)